MATLYARSVGDVLALLTAVVAAPGVTVLRAILNRGR